MVLGLLAVVASLVEEHRLPGMRASEVAAVMGHGSVAPGMWDPSKPEIEPMSTALQGGIFNHWTTRVVLLHFYN